MTTVHLLARSTNVVFYFKCPVCFRVFILICNKSGQKRKRKYFRSKINWKSPSTLISSKSSSFHVMNRNLIELIRPLIFNKRSIVQFYFRSVPFHFSLFIFGVMGHTHLGKGCNIAQKKVEQFESVDFVFNIPQLQIKTSCQIS